MRTLNVNPGAFVSSLPVAAVLPELLSALQHAPQVLLNAPTGAGKSTAAAADPRRGQHRGTHYPARAEAPGGA